MAELNLQDWIIQELEVHHWSMRELARRAGISHSWISNVLAGQSPSWDFCAAIAGPFGVSPIEVLLRADKVSIEDIQRVLPTLPEGQVEVARQVAAIVETLEDEDRHLLLKVANALKVAASDRDTRPPDIGTTDL